MTYTIVVRQDDGTETDVTEGVQALYDHTVNSMDWGSGFLTVEDALGIIKVALTCGFLVPDTAQEQFSSYAQIHGVGIKCQRCARPAFYSHDPGHRGWHHGRAFAAEPSDHAVQIWPADA